MKIFPSEIDSPDWNKIFRMYLEKLVVLLLLLLLVPAYCGRRVPEFFPSFLLGLSATKRRRCHWLPNCPSTAVRFSSQNFAAPFQFETSVSHSEIATARCLRIVTRCEQQSLIISAFLRAPFSRGDQLFRASERKYSSLRYAGFPPPPSCFVHTVKLKKKTKKEKTGVNFWIFPTRRFFSRDGGKCFERTVCRTRGRWGGAFPPPPVPLLKQLILSG